MASWPGHTFLVRHECHWGLNKTCLPREKAIGLRNYRQPDRMRMPVPRRPCPRNTIAIPPLLLAVAALLALPPPVLAQSVRTVVVPSGSGVVVAPRSAPPRLAARPPATLPAAPAGPRGLPEAEPETGSVMPLLSLVPLAAAAALFAAGSSGDGGAPSRTR